MGQTTSNMSIYIPSNGETLYGDSFAAGMLNVDQHDHSGPPNKGVPLSSSGLADYSVTAIKLNNTGSTAVVDITTGLGFNGSNQIQTTGLLNALNGVGTLGLLVQTSAGAAATTRSITGVAGEVDVTNGNGVGGNPLIGLSSSTKNLIPSILNSQIITSSGTYTPSAGMIYCIVEVIGGGGGGGGVAATGSDVAAAGGGGSGGYSRSFFTAADIGASKSVTIGNGGSGGAAGANNGGNGGTTSMGSLIQATGGSGGQGSSNNTSVITGGGNPGQGSLGQLNLYGNGGGNGLGFIASGSTTFALGGAGAASILGGMQVIASVNAGGGGGLNFGAGGGGATSSSSGPAAGGGNGAPGAVIITEFCHA